MTGHRSNLVAIIDPRNLDSMIDPIQISEKFLLRNLNDDEMRYLPAMRGLSHLSPFWSIPSLYPSHCVLEFTEDIPQEDAFHVVERALTLLRLSAPGCIGVLTMWIKGDHPLRAWAVDVSPLLATTAWPGFQNTYVIPDDLSQLTSIADRLWHRLIRGDSVVRWFNKSFSEKYIEDKLLDLIFALEQIYLRGEGKPEYLSYKFALRCAFLLAESEDERTGIFANARCGYNMRSRIVHQGKLPKDLSEMSEVMVNLEEYLRKSLLKYLYRELPFNLKSGDLTDFWDKLILSGIS